MSRNQQRSVLIGVMVFFSLVLIVSTGPSIVVGAGDQYLSGTQANSVQRDYRVVWGYACCLDGSPIQGAQVSLKYICEGNDRSNEPVPAVTDEDGYYCFMRSELNCRPDYGFVSVQYGLQHRLKFFNTVGVEKNVHFYCGHVLPSSGSGVLESTEVTQLAR